MRKSVMVILAVVAILVLGGEVFAATVTGTIKSVDAAAKSLEITLQNGQSQWINYTGTTQWPAGVTDPITLRNKAVSITSDDKTGMAMSVALSTQPLAPKT